MNRTVIAIVPLFLGLLLIGSVVDAADAAERPNILFIAIDDQNDWIGYLGGHPQIKTPYIDSLATRGVGFTNAHCQSPLCNPSRTSLMTGLRPSTTGIYGLAPWFRQTKWKDRVSLPQHLQQNGYHTYSTGKIYHGGYGRRKTDQEFQHLGPPAGVGARPKQKLVDTPAKHPLVDWGVFPHQDHEKGDWKVASWAVDQLNAKPQEPFFLSVGFFLPHVPCYATQEWFDLYPESQLKLPPLDRKDRDDTPRFSWYLHWRLPEPRFKFLEEEKQWKNLVRSYLACTSFVDAQVGRVLGALEANGYEQNTIIVLWSDHGWHLGEKLITGKNTLWDRSTRVPLIFAGPGVAIGKGTCNQPAELLDIYPTLIDLCGLSERRGLEGHSLAPQLKDPNAKRPWPAITTHNHDNHGVRSEHFRYIHYADGSEELYDMRTDPNEWTNLAGMRLREQTMLCDELAVIGSLLSQGLSDPDQFLEWLESEGWFRRRAWLLAIARVLSVAFLLTLVGFIMAPESRDLFGAVGLVLIAINVILSVSFTGSMHDVFFQVTTPSGEMQHYRQLFALMKQLPSDEPLLRSLRDIVVDVDHGAERQLTSLQRIMDLANLRRAGLFGALYMIFQITILWDFHVMSLLERWRVAFRNDAAHWFDALGELEALACLASVARDHPDWTFPDVHANHDALNAEQIGHPLLPPDACVRNDASVGPRNSVLLVTGSNMSGKSTLLRSIGLNAVLAHTGSPVCAASFHSPPLVVATSMRIVDSLDDGVSFFMAELKRLKEIVDQADHFHDEDGPTLLYLLDEILQGTNSSERRIAVARVVAHLLARHAIGAISTHDLELAAEPLLASACRPVHFRESFHEEDGVRRMTFDYRIHQGVAPTTNALVLLEMVGLGGGDEK